MPKSILLVEDTKPLADSLADILRMEGFKVVIAHDGSMALQELNKAIPDVILTDLVMPGMSGSEMLHRIKSHAKYRSIPVIIHSAHAAAANKLAGQGAGADLFFEKPVDVDKLIASILILTKSRSDPDR